MVERWTKLFKKSRQILAKNINKVILVYKHLYHFASSTFQRLNGWRNTLHHHLCLFPERFFLSIPPPNVCLSFVHIRFLNDLYYTLSAIKYCERCISCLNEICEVCLWNNFKQFFKCHPPIIDFETNDIVGSVTRSDQFYYKVAQMFPDF